MTNGYMNTVVALWRREIKRFFRQKGRVIGALATPLMFWFLIGGGLRNSFVDSEQPFGNYFSYFFPGSIVLSVLFTAIFSTISVIEDRHQGFLQGVLVSPAPRSAIVLGKTLGGATLGLIQGALLMLFAPLAGVGLGFEQVLLGFILLFAMALALTGLGFFFAWKLDSVQGYHSIMNTVLIPLWLLSGAVFPLSGAHDILRFVGKVNPLSYAVAAFRDVIAGHIIVPFVFASLAIMLLCSLFFILANSRMVARSSF